MKHFNARLCAEFPSDNPHLLGDEATEVAVGFDWDATERRAKELSSSWRKPPEPPETFPPTLQAGALDEFTGGPPSVQDIDATGSCVDELDPFIAELQGLITDGGYDGSYDSAAPETDFDAVLEESGEQRTLPRVQVAPRAPEPPLPDLVPLASGVQPLAPLFLELTPTPAHVTPWTELTGTLSRHLLSEGHTRAAALIAPLLNGELVDLSRLPPASLELLVVSSVAEKRGGLVVCTSAFRDSARAFREEFYGGGLNAADALFWLSQLLCALTGGLCEEEAFEATLRDLGVAKLLERAA